MQYKKGDRVQHPKKPEWGIGQVLSDSVAGTVRVFFANAGEKTISLDFVLPEKLSRDGASSAVLDAIGSTETPIGNAKGKVLCHGHGWRGIARPRAATSSH
ncbi:DUF3553 domain-containing protein [Paraburkholderia sp. MM6662-R1]|uniref:DUF3553 domain-containing protein n=1 Tax=Paraburkholderia sp. MM6662-R1 TaxID=2991066 RepID=UPI003D1BC084